jgi:peptidoglycan/xylan/chitin deacetylase (PgdA/CDA1 family)
MSLLKNKRNMALTACRLSQAHRWWGLLDHWHGLVVLNYHRIGDPAQTTLDPGVYSATAEQFETQLRRLRADCDVIRVADVADVLRSESKRRSVLITFDDGYLDNYELAFPVLQQVGLPAVIFLATGFLDDRFVAWWDEIAWMVKRSTNSRLVFPATWGLDTQTVAASARDRAAVTHCLLRVAKTMTPPELSQFLDDLAQVTGTGRAPRNSETAPWMTWDMVREMHRGGIDFGGHTVTHPVLSKCSLDQQRAEIQQSKARIEEELGSAITAFSYPIGQSWAMTDDTRRLVREAGYQWGFNFCPGYATSACDPYDIQRVAMEPRIGLSELRATVRIPRLFAR